jgi:tetratricopeptide (TPR) repeat protein
MSRKLGIIIITFFFTGSLASAQDAFTMGEELFMQNKPAEALPLLEAASLEDPANLKPFLYLGIIYLQLERIDDAIAVYLKILPRGGEETPRIAYNLGNAYYTKGDTETATRYYTQAIEADPGYAPAYLNRANTQVRSGKPGDAIPDYRRYLSLDPQSLKRSQIERLIAFINEEAAAEERRRILAEAQARAEEERRRKLLEEVSASLQTVADDSRGISSGSEDVLNYEGEFELE